MKQFLLIAFIVTALVSCQSDAEQDTMEGRGESSALNLTINVNKALSSRAIEDGHDGVNGDKVSPKIFAVTVLSYNEAGTPLGTTDLTPSQITQAIYGNYRNPNGTSGSQTAPGAGTKVGLPKGTTHVDVVVNRAPLSSYTAESNINYLNYRNNKNGSDKTYPYGSDNFDRVILTTYAYEKGGVALAGHEDPTITTTPTYKLDFSVKPYLARMEVYGGINVAAEEIWTDGYGNKWRTMSVSDYESFGNIADADGHYPKGVVKGTVANGFDVNTVYIPEYYWYRASGLANPVIRDASNTFETEAEVNNPATENAGWVKQSFYGQAGPTGQVMWLPNRFYAVDVESIFLNNIKVRSASHTPYRHPWPENQTSTGWVDWYKAFHIGGWHETGVSVGNTFLCLGNMWDRLATSQTNMTIDFPALGEVSTMQLLTGKAEPIANVSQYYSTDRNLGIKTGRAAGYAIYPQAKSASTSVSDASVLRNEMPHIIVKLKAYKNAADYAAGTYLAGKEFITITLFSEGKAGAGNYITNFQGGFIYRLNLDDLRYQFIGDVPVPEGNPTDGVDPKDPTDPDPEMPESQLIMNVQVQPWLLQNIYPNI